MAILKINKTRDFFKSNYTIFVNGIKVGTISDEKTKVFDISPGKHIIYAKIAWCRSSDLNILVHESTQEITLVIDKNKYVKNLLPISVLILCLHLILKLFWAFNYTYHLLAIVGLLLGYYFTLAKKEYLVIENLKIE